MPAISSLTFFLSICCGVFGSSALAQQEPWHDKEFIADSFVKISLRDEYSTNSKRNMIRKWHQPIRAYVKSTVGNAKLQKEMVGVQLNHLAVITGHSIGFVSSIDDANLIIIFTLKNNMTNSMKALGLYNEGSATILEEAACLANITVTNKGEIFKAAIHIPVDSTRSSGLFLNCIVEEITQVMGLLNDSDEVFPSIFNDYSIDGYLSGLDYLLLKLLYHPKIKAGMEEDQVRSIMTVLLSELGEAGFIASASTEVLPNSIRVWSGDE